MDPRDRPLITEDVRSIQTRSTVDIGNGVNRAAYGRNIATAGKDAIEGGFLEQRPKSHDKFAPAKLRGREELFEMSEQAEIYIDKLKRSLRAKDREIQSIKEELHVSAKKSNELSSFFQKNISEVKFCS